MSRFSLKEKMNRKLDDLFCKPLFTNAIDLHKKNKTRRRIVYSIVIISSALAICLPLANTIIHFHNKRLFEESLAIGNSKPWPPGYNPYTYYIVPRGTYSATQNVQYKIYFQFPQENFEDYQYSNCYIYFSISFSNEKRNVHNPMIKIQESTETDDSKLSQETVYSPQNLPFDNEYLFASYYINRKLYKKYQPKNSYEYIPSLIFAKFKWLYDKYTFKVTIPIELFKKYADTYKYFHIIWYFNEEIKLFCDKNDFDDTLQCFYCTSTEYELDNDYLRTDYAIYENIEDN